MSAGTGTGTTAKAKPKARRGEGCGLLLLVLAIAAAVVVTAHYVVRPPLVRLLADATEPNLRVAAVAGWAAFLLPLWAAWVWYLLRRLTRRVGEPSRVLFLAWLATLLVPFGFIPGKGSTNRGEYRRSLLEDAGAMGQAIGLGALGAVLVTILTPFVVGGTFFLVHRLRSEAWRLPDPVGSAGRWLGGDRGWPVALLGGLTAAQLAGLGVTLAVGDLRVDPAELRRYAEPAPLRPGPAYDARPAARARDLAPLATVQVSADGGWDRLALADDAGCDTAAAAGPSLDALRAGGCASTARVLFGDENRGLVAALTVVDMRSALAAERAREQVFERYIAEGITARPLPLPPENASAGLRAAHARLAERTDPLDDDLRASVRAVGPAVAILTVARTPDGVTAPAFLAAAGELTALPEAHAAYEPIRPRLPAGSTSILMASQLFPRPVAVLSERGSWRRLATADSGAAEECAGVLANVESPSSSFDPLPPLGGCRGAARILLADPSRGLVATIAVIDIPGAADLQFPFGDRGVLAAPLPLPAPLPVGIDAAAAARIRAAYRALADPRGTWDTESSAREELVVVITVAGPREPGDDLTFAIPADGDRSDAHRELFRWISGYLRPLP